MTQWKTCRLRGKGWPYGQNRSFLPSPLRSWSQPSIQRRCRGCSSSSSSKALPHVGEVTVQGKRKPWAGGVESKIKKQNLPKRRAFPGKGFGSILSKDPPYLRGKIFIVWEVTPKEMLCPK